MRRALLADWPALPVALFEELVRVPDDWTRTPAAYLRLSNEFEAAHAEALARGLLVRAMAGGAWSPVTDPEGVAEVLVELADGLAEMCEAPASAGD